ncbi:MAG: lipocalin family protein [Ferruginibacter sp.]
MKKFILPAFAFVLALSSCKKDDTSPSCEKTVAGIAGSYKVTKIETITAGITQDVTTSILDACQISGVIQLKSDKTFTYTESGGTCTDNGAGTWDVVSGALTINSTSGGSYDVDNATISSWNCSTLVVSESANLGGVTIEYRSTLTKQ